MSDKEERLSRAVSASARRHILRLLVGQERSVKELATNTGISVSLASRHLQLLHDLGFLKVRKEFPHKFYSLKVKELAKLLEIYDLVIRKI